MNTGAFGEGFPYTNFHDLNMDWIIKIAKDFLDQYTNIQQIIADGEQSILDKTDSGLSQLQETIDSGLTQLQDKADEIETLLNQWYTTHSNDIANQLADALSSINTTLLTAIATFTTQANQRGQEVIDSIPDDYTTLAQTVDDWDILFQKMGLKEPIPLASGKYISTNSPIDITNLLTNANFSCVAVSCIAGDQFIISGQSALNNVRLWTFIRSDGTIITQAGYNNETNHANNTIIVAPQGSAYMVFNSDSANPTYHYTPSVAYYPQLGDYIDIIKSNLSYYEQGRYSKFMYMGNRVLKETNSSMTFIASSEVNASYFAIQYPTKYIFNGATIKNGGVIIYNKGSENRVRLRITNSYDWGGSNGVAIVSAFTTIHKGFNFIPFIKDVTPSNTPNENNVYIAYEWSDATYGNIYTEYIENAEIFESSIKLNQYNIVFWGDSLTSGSGGSGTTYPAVCSNILHATHFNGGVGGEASETVACRAGANEIVIPAGSVNGTYTNEDLRDLILAYPCGLLKQGSAGVNPIYINGHSATLARNGNTFTISDYAGSAIAYDTIAECSGSRITGDLAVIFMGENNIAVPEETWFKFIENIGSKYPNYIVLGLSTGTASSRATLESHFKTRFGNKYFNTRKMLVENGLATVNITPTTQDNTDIANGTVPSSLRTDETHLNANGYTALGTLLASFIQGLSFDTWNR